MSSGSPGNLPAKDLLRAYLSKWVAQLTPDPDEQRRLVDQTVAVALDDPDVLDAEDVEDALKRVMHRLNLPDTSTRISASGRE